VPGSHQPFPDRWDYGWHVHVGAGDLVAGSLPSLETSSSNFGLSAISFLMAYLFVLGSPIDRENFLGQEIISQANAFIPQIVIGLWRFSREEF
jgi:hypothetical protein